MADEKPGKDPKPKYDLNVNRKNFDWDRPQITGAEIKVLAGSPPDYVVNQIVSGPGDDPEIGDRQPVELDHKVEPKGIKKFLTRKPQTSPGVA